MSLQFIFGNSGSGKSHYLYKKVIEASMENPQKNYIVLVPEQFTMQTQKDLVLMHPNKGIMNIDVLSFGRLAHRVFEEVGGNTRTVLDDEGKNLILRKIAGDYEQELVVLKGNLKKLGYISEVKSVISEFTQYDIGSKELERMISETDEGTYLYYKLQDIKKIYEGFYRYLEEKYITKEELLDVLCDVTVTSRLLKDSVIVLDGFTGFTPVQNRLLKELMTVCEQVIVTVTMDGREDPYVLKHKYQLFALSKQMVIGLVQIAGEHRILMEEPVCLYDRPVYRFRENKTLGFLESELFRYSKKRFEQEPEGLEIHTVRSPKEEVEFAAREIRKLVRTEGYRYREIAVVTSDMSVYADYMEKVFHKFEIPVFMDHKRSILLNSFVEYLRSLLAMVTKNYTYESVFRFLRTGLAGFSPDETDTLENYIIALGLKGYKKWQEPWIRRMNGMKEPELAEVNALRVRFVEKVDRLHHVLKRRKKTVKDITLAVYEYMAAEKLQQQLTELELRFQENGELELAKEYAQIYRIVVELFEKFVELLGDVQLPLKEYCELLDAGLEEAKVGVIPPSLDQVTAGDTQRSRLKEIRALFLVGVNDTLIPGKLGLSGLLSERDREVLEKQQIVLSPGGKEKAYIQKFYLYLHMTKPKERLYLSYSKVSSEGKSLRPAYLIPDIKRLYPKLTVIEEERKTLGELELTKETGISYLIQGLRNKSESCVSEWKELYSWYRRNPDWSERIMRLVEASFYERPKDRLSAQLALTLYRDHQHLSVTRMERFSACAFAHFLQYGLQLRERQEYEFQAVDLGNIFHSAIEHFSRKVEQEGYAWTNLPKDLRKRFIEESVDESITDYGNTILYSSARNEYMITRMKRMLHRTVWALTKQLERGDFQPSGYEVNFGSGKIDRIDTCMDEDKVYVKVMDYKTGSKAFDLTALYHGLQLQLVVYLNAALELEQKRNPGKEMIPAGIFYYQMKDPIVGKEKDERKLQESILKELKLDGLVNADEIVIEHLDRDLTGNSLVIPVGRNKDQSLSRASKAVTSEEFDVISKYTRQTMHQIEERMRKGEVQASPYEMGTQTGCDYCRFRDICGFDAKIEGNDFRRLMKMKPDEVLQKMKEEV